MVNGRINHQENQYANDEFDEYQSENFFYSSKQ